MELSEKFQGPPGTPGVGKPGKPGNPGVQGIPGENLWRNKFEIIFFQHVCKILLNNWTILHTLSFLNNNCSISSLGSVSYIYNNLWLHLPSFVSRHGYTQKLAITSQGTQFAIIVIWCERLKVQVFYSRI